MLPQAASANVGFTSVRYITYFHVVAFKAIKACNAKINFAI
jgi:hypothetical protein